MVDYLYSIFDNRRALRQMLLTKNEVLFKAEEIG